MELVSGSFETDMIFFNLCEVSPMHSFVWDKTMYCLRTYGSAPIKVVRFVMSLNSFAGLFLSRHALYSTNLRNAKPLLCYAQPYRIKILFNNNASKQE